MKSYRSLRPRILMALPVACLFIAGLAARGNLVEWLQNLEGSGRFEMVFFRTVSLPGGPVTVRRLPEASGISRALAKEAKNSGPSFRRVRTSRCPPLMGGNSVAL